jgi:hypothetical protein
MVSKIPKSSKSVFLIIRNILNLGWVEIPDVFHGTGAPGNTLEHLVDIDVNNNDSPDLQDWELKFHGGGPNLLTLFHKEAEPKGIMNVMVNEFGWLDQNRRISFRHTISGSSERGFQVKNIDNRIVVKNIHHKNFEAYWEHNILLGQLAAKLRRLIIVHGIYDRPNRKVIYNNAIAYWEPDLIGFCNAIEQGIILIDFDARTTRGKGTSLRNHGTKFRIKIENIGVIYQNSEIINP